MPQERRKSVRRQNDRDLREELQSLRKLASEKSAQSKETERARRRSIRHSCQVRIDQVFGYSTGGADAWNEESVRLKGRLLDLSAGGASLFTKERLETGHELRLAIELRDGARIHTAAEVRWVKNVPEKGGYASGVKFRRVSDSDAKLLRNFMNELDETMGL